MPRRKIKLIKLSYALKQKITRRTDRDLQLSSPSPRLICPLISIVFRLRLNSLHLDFFDVLKIDVFRIDKLLEQLTSIYPHYCSKLSVAFRFAGVV